MSPHRVEPEQSDMETEQNDVETSENNIDTSDEEPNSEGRETTNKESTDDIQGPRCPVFCLTEPTDAYWEELAKQLGGVVPELFVISSNSPDRDTIIKESEAKLAYPFLGSSREDVYEFFRKNIRPADDSTKVEPFTYFSFMVIDSDCANSTPYQCVVCSDAPDYDEPSGAIKLKATRVPIEEAALILNCMEQLYMTPSEASNPNSDSLFSIPPFTQKDDPNMCDDAETFVPATPAEARKNKERGIQAFVDRPIKDYPVALVPERRATLGKCPRGEARLSSSAHRYMECLSKTTGTILAYKSNPSEEVSEEVKKRAERTREQVEAVGRLTSA